MDYFQLYDIPLSLKVDKTELQKKYYALSRQYHPDHFTLQDKFSQENAERLSSLINEGKKNLEDSYKRLEYILKLKNKISNEDKQTLAPEFLSDMMEINEQLMEIEMNENEDAKIQLKENLLAVEKKMFTEVESYFNQEKLDIDDVGYERLKNYYFKKKYLQRILDRI